jgi:hypothetical protein
LSQQKEEDSFEASESEEQDELDDDFIERLQLMTRPEIE